MTANLKPTKVDFLERKKLGIFYTPSNITDVLCNWAIRSPNDYIIEPSFGGCGFLESSYQRLSELKNSQPLKQLYGCDIDKNAFDDYLFPKYKNEDFLLGERFIRKDFLELHSEDFPRNSFTACVGNPPYVSYHSMSDEQRVSSLNLAKSLRLKLDKRASLWAYFLLQSINFIEENGRIAFVLPGSFLSSNYSKTIRDFISKKFGKSLAIQMGERLFSSEGTQENTVIILAENFSKKKSANSDMNVTFVANTANLEDTISSWSKEKGNFNVISSRASYEMISKEIDKTLKNIEEIASTIELSDIATISIGVVTGANNFFVVNKSTVDEWDIHKEYQTPIFSKFRMTNGIKFTPDDYNKKVDEDFPCIFIDTLDKKRIRDKKLQKYLKSFPIKQRESNVTFSKREIWHSPLYKNIPDAFFPYMHNSGPRIILNDAKTLCTNTIHRVFFKEFNGKVLSRTQKKFLAISILSSFSQLSAELEGRAYGSGALKIEPGEAKRIKLVFPLGLDENIVNESFDRIDKLLRENYSKQTDSQSNEEARKEADKLIIKICKNIGLEESFDILSSSLKIVRARRKKW